MIKLEHVNKVFNKHKKNKINVINNTSIDFASNGLVAILGPSGCGKTTLLNVIGGLDKVNSGKIYVDGKKITKIRTSKLDKIRNLNIGYIFQDYKLIENLSVFDNVAIVLKMLGIKDKKEIEKRVLYTLDKVNMLRYKKRPVTMLSGGERQRVGIARALVKNPKIIIADEPTGNLDSKNSIEIMNIIKKISTDRLVILVTHEEELAKFYANRIVELEDGKIVNDYENTNTGSLDYQIENKIYLKDFHHHDKLKKNDINIDIYSNEEEKVKLDIVFKNGNIYIKSNNLDKIEVVDNNIELIDDHYKKVEDVNALVDDFDIDSISNKKYKEKYSSIFRLGNFITVGFKNILNYSLIKKLLLGGFFLSGMFIFYAISNGFASLKIDDSDFIEVNKNYLEAKIGKISVDDYLRYESDSNTNYILPSDSLVNFNIKYDKFYQTSFLAETMTGSISSINMLTKDDLLYGNLPSKIDEIVIDKMVAKNVIKKGTIVQVGITNVKDFIGLEVSLEHLGNFKIVGVTDLESPSIYANQNILINIINNSAVSDSEEITSSDSKNEAIKYVDYNYDINNYTLVKGSLPINDYEIMVNIQNEYEMPINKTIKTKINNHKLKVVGYYKSEELNNYVYYTNYNTIKYNLINNTNNIVVYSKDNNKTQELFLDRKINLRPAYEMDKKKYQEENKDSLKSTLIVCSVILIISLLEIFLMIRSSFLSRVKEVGILRAIGVKKSDIYKMFAGEIIAITTVASVTGILFMTYILYNISNIEFIASMYMVNIVTILTSIILVYIFNLVVGLLPVFTTIRKTPAQILSRQDIN